MIGNFDITPYLIGLLSLLSLFLTSWLIPMLKSKTTIAQQEIIRAIVNTVVYAAEQLFGSGTGKEKLAYATGKAIEFLAKHGIRLDAETVRPYIESAVLELQNAFVIDVPFDEDDADGPVEGLAEWIRSDDESKE